jgi:hypothetical protein
MQTVTSGLSCILKAAPWTLAAMKVATITAAMNFIGVLLPLVQAEKQ